MKQWRGMHGPYSARYLPLGDLFLNFDFADKSLVHALKGNTAEQVLADREARSIINNGLFVSVRDVFRVQVELSSSSSTRQIEATVEFSGGKHGYHVVRWNEYNTNFYLD